MKAWTASILLALGMAWISPTEAQDPCESLGGAQTGWRNILRLGCQMSDSECFVTLDGDAFGQAGCFHNQARWNAKGSANARVALAQFTTAWVSGKKLNLCISPQCYVQPTSGTAAWPGFEWYHIADEADIEDYDLGP